jgi:hypothetical protein
LLGRLRRLLPGALVLLGCFGVSVGLEPELVRVLLRLVLLALVLALVLLALVLA